MSENVSLGTEPDHLKSIDYTKHQIDLNSHFLRLRAGADQSCYMVADLRRSYIDRLP